MKALESARCKLLGSYCVFIFLLEVVNDVIELLSQLHPIIVVIDIVSSSLFLQEAFDVLHLLLDQISERERSQHSVSIFWVHYSVWFFPRYCRVTLPGASIHGILILGFD